MKDKKYTNIGNFYVEDSDKALMDARLKDIMYREGKRQLGEVVEHGDDTFSVKHPNGLETLYGLVEHKKGGYKIAASFNANAIPGQYYVGILENFQQSVVIAGDGFTADALVVTDKKQVAQDSGKLYDGIDLGKSTEVFSVQPLEGYPGNVAEMKASFRCDLDHISDNKWVAGAIVAATKDLDGVNLTNLDVVHEISREIDRENAEMER